MLTYLFIAFVVVVALVPLTHFAPSKGQRRIVHMREMAALSGLFVEFRSLPAALQRGAPTPRNLIYYGKRLQPAKGTAVASGQWLREAQQWRSADRRSAVPAALQDLPADVFAASVDAQSCGVYWVESAREEDAREVISAVQRWAQDLLA